MDLSVIIPVHDEAENFAPLHQELAAVQGSLLAVLMGLLAELMVRTYFESQDKRVYPVKTLINIE